MIFYGPGIIFLNLSLYFEYVESLNFSFQANWIFLIMQNYQLALLVLISQKSKLEFWCSTWADQGILERSSNFWQIYSRIVISSSCHFNPYLVHWLPKGVLLALLKSIMKSGVDRRFSIGQLNRCVPTYLLPKDVTIGVTGTTAVAPKFSDTTTLIQGLSW